MPKPDDELVELSAKPDLAKYAGSIMQAVVIALLVWVGDSLRQLTVDGAAKTVEIEHVAALVTKIEQRLDALYLRSDAEQMYNHFEMEINKLDVRVRDLERGD